MSLMHALVLLAEDQTAQVAQIPRPQPSDFEILVRIHVVALNPVDSLYVFNPLGSTGRIVGSDFAGVVEKTSEKGNGDGIKLAIGARVAGFVQGASSINDRPGAFAEFVAIPEDLVWKIPDSISFAEAASISLCGLTAAQALFGEGRLELTAPWNEDDAKHAHKTVLIYGASTSVGLYAAQLIRRTNENIKLIGCASSKHFDVLRAEPYRYDELLDYRSDWQTELSKGTGFDLAYDCISEGSTVQDISKLLKFDGKMAIVRSAEGGAWSADEALSVQPSYRAVWEGLGEEVQYQGMRIPANAGAREFAVEFYRWLSVKNHALKPNSVRVMPGGLQSIVNDGFRLLGSGSMDNRVVDREEPWMRPISAEKLVYIIR